ncbi:MAG: DoxX family protein, partial [Bacteroidota bacterium]
YFKFTAHPEAVHIFSTIGMEPWGRIGVGVGELIASTMLLIPATIWMGAAMGIGLMMGALFFHLTTPLGIQVMFTDANGQMINDHGQLFLMALIVLVCCAIILWKNKENMLSFINKFIGKK